MKIKSLENNEVSFDSLEVGNVFEFNKKFYLKIHNIHYITGSLLANAIDLTYMIGTEFPDSALVYPLESKLVLTRKLEEK